MRRTRPLAAIGEDIVWAVVDSGVDEEAIPTFSAGTIRVVPLQASGLTGGADPLVDEFGHGTHVAGILAGSASVSSGQGGRAASLTAEIRTVSWQRNEAGEIITAHR